MDKSLRLLFLCAVILSVAVFSCENKQKAEINQAGSRAVAGPIVDASKQVPLKGPYTKEKGYCWQVMLPEYESSADNMQEGTRSKLVLYEDGKPLGPAHSMHDDIRAQGKGRYSHWSGGGIYFSTSDNSDPNRNGKKYTFSM